MKVLEEKELDLIRSQTKGCARMVHFNNAGASLPPDLVVETVIDYLREEAFAGGYETEAKYAEKLAGVYDSVARLIGADRNEVAIFENASAAWGTAFRGLSFEAGDEIITTEMEYVTNLIGLVDSQRDNGVVVRVVPNDAEGNFCILELEKAIGVRTKLIMVTHISSSGGSVLPVEQIGELAERSGILYLVDACQSVGQLPIDVRKIKCDMLSATGRKYLRAPRGTGFLFVRKESQDRLKPVLLDFLSAGNVSLSGYTLRGDARRFELYEKSRALTLGLGMAVDYALGIGMERIWERIESLSQLMRSELAGIPGITMHDHGVSLSGIVTFSVKDEESAGVKSWLAERGINVSVGGQQATPIYMDHWGLGTVLRASVHYYNTEGEIAALCRELKLMTSS